jgi:competence protein ComEA
VKIDRKRLWILAWFTFTRRERNGVLLLSIILLVLQSVLIYRNFIAVDRSPVQLTEEEKGWVRELKSAAVPSPSIRVTLVDEKLDPNDLSAGEWIQYGLSPKQAKVVMNWREKGGVFRSKEDVKEMKFIPERVYKLIEPYLVFNVTEESPKAEILSDKREHHEYKRRENPVPELIDLNLADTLKLQELPLVGAGRARTIWKFRERLGGYYSKEQLREIKILPDSVLAVIFPRVEIKSPVYRKINLNTLENDSLYHPYFSKALLRMIISYRAQQGPYNDASVLRSFPLVDEDLWRKIAPYLSTAH